MQKNARMLLFLKECLPNPGSGYLLLRFQQEKLGSACLNLWLDSMCFQLLFQPEKIGSGYLLLRFPQENLSSVHLKLWLQPEKLDSRRFQLRFQPEKLDSGYLPLRFQQEKLSSACLKLRLQPEKLDSRHFQLRFQPEKFGSGYLPLRFQQEKLKLRASQAPDKLGSGTSSGSTTARLTAGLGICSFDFQAKRSFFVQK